MKIKGIAHKALSFMFQCKGVLPSMVIDGSKEQTLGKFCPKLVDTHCQLKQTEAHFPQQNSAKREIKELKKGSGGKMLAPGAPRRLLDDCLELDAYMRSHSTNTVYHLDGKVPKMYMPGETADISQFHKFAWYNWIIYSPGTIDYPDEPLCLGKYLGPAIDVGLAMTAKILQHNGKVVDHSMYHPLTIEEWSGPTVIQNMVTFRETTEERIGVKLTCAEHEEVSISDSPEYVPYANENENEMTFSHLDEEVIPEVGDE